MENDLISRQAAIDAVRGRFSMPVDNLIVEVIGNLPSVQPKQRRVDVENVLALLDGIHSSGRMEYYSDYCALYDAIAGLLPG